MSGRYSQTLHVWFIDDRLLGAAMHEGPVWEIGPKVIETANSHESTDLHLTSRTTPIDDRSCPVELVYKGTCTIDDGHAVNWRHVFLRPSEPWPTEPRPEATP